MFAKPRKRPKRLPDWMDPAERQYVMLRDRYCFGFRIDPAHVCYDAFGNRHSPYDLDRLTVEGVKDQLRMGKRATHDRWHCVAACHRLNVGVPSKELRAAMRSYLALLASS